MVRLVISENHTKARVDNTKRNNKMRLKRVTMSPSLPHTMPPTTHPTVEAKPTLARAQCGKAINGFTVARDSHIG